MSKLFNILKYILSIILIIFNIIYIYNFGLTSIYYLIYIVLFIIFIILLISDLFKRNKINLNSKYNILCIFVFIVMLLIFFRALYDKSFLYNNSSYRELYLIQNINIDIYNLKISNILYVSQNSIYFIIFMIMLIMYHKINSDKFESNYSFISLLCFVLSIVSIMPSIMFISNSLDNVIFYLLFNILLIIFEIYSLIKYNHKKREWIIYLSFFFNMWAFISIFISIFYY